MQYYLSDSGEQRGPFTLEQLRSMWAAGTITGLTPYWEEGLTEWLPLSTISDELEPRRTAPPVSTQSQVALTGGENGLGQVLALLGSALLFIGVFCPIISVPIVGQMNYFQNGKGDGTIILVLAVASVALVAVKRYPLLWLTGGGSLATILFTFVRFQSGMSSVKKQMETDLHDNPFAGLAQMAIQSVQIQWGIGILAIGAVLVIAGAAMLSSSKKRH